MWGRKYIEEKKIWVKTSASPLTSYHLLESSFPFTHFAIPFCKVSMKMPTSTVYVGGPMCASCLAQVVGTVVSFLPSSQFCQSWTCSVENRVQSFHVHFGVYCVQTANFSKSLEIPESICCPKHSPSGPRCFPGRWLTQITRGQWQVFSSDGDSSSYSVAQSQAAAESEGAESVALSLTAARLRGCPEVR